MAEKGVMGNGSAVGLKMAPRVAICCSLEKEKHDMACAYSALPVLCCGRDWIKCECLRLLTDRRAQGKEKIGSAMAMATASQTTFEPRSEGWVVANDSGFLRE